MSIGELFWQALPQFMAIGMTPEEFWHGDPRLAVAYREAARVRQDNRYVDEWRAGIYVLQALIAAAPAFREFSKGKEVEYPSKPLFSVRQDYEEAQEKQEADKMARMLAVFDAKVNAVNRALEQSAEQPMP